MHDKKDVTADVLMTLCLTWDFFQQMRLIHGVPFSSHEIEYFRKIIFNNLTYGLKLLLDAMQAMGLEVSERNKIYLDCVYNVNDIQDGEPFPWQYYKPLKLLWADPNVEQAWQRGNEASLPEK
jgi:guanine nucleotide-binding protein subunit alpha